ncbi:hypothetical protein ACHWQZ_G017158 [Mnemiopsis leidyi]
MEKSELSKAWSIDPRERIKALSELASGSVSISHGIPIKRYYRSGVELERMAKVYEDENNLEKAFFLYMKYTTLFVECLPKHPDLFFRLFVECLPKHPDLFFRLFVECLPKHPDLFFRLFVECLPKHPDYKSPQTSNERKVVRSKLKTIFDRAEFIKNNLTITYAGQHKKWIMEEQIRKAEAEQKRLEEEARIEAEAVAAKRAEMERRETELALELEQIEKQLEETRTIAVKASEKPVVVPPPMQRQATYPSLPVETPAKQSNTSSFNEAFNMRSPATPLAAPSLSLPSAPSAPSAHIQIISDTGPFPTVDRSTKPAAPQIDRSTKPATLAASDMFAEMMTQDSQRAVIIPSSLPDKFLSVCLDNTQKNVETCGILAAKLTANNFTITHVILPKQRGTPDSCQTLAEEELFEYQDKLDLITVGWIHYRDILSDRPPWSGLCQQMY